MINKLKRAFTLMELIVVIVVIGILAAIVIPNISSFKEDAERKSILADTKNIQTAVDVFRLRQDGKTPTKETPTFGDPKVIEIYGLKPKYIRNIPKERKVKFWLDSDHIVWASLVDAPQNVNYEEGKVTWDTVEGAVSYNLYKSSSDVLSSVKESKQVQFLKTVTPSGLTKEEHELPILEKGIYLVSAIDAYGFESPRTKVGTTYSGYGDGPDKDYMVGLEGPQWNQKPKSVMSFSPSTNLDTNTVISWNHDQSTDPEGHKIVGVEWVLNGQTVESMPSKLFEGSNIVKMRVLDEKGAWSDYESREIVVKKAGFTPSTLSESRAFGSLSTYTTNQVVLSSNGEKMEAFYYPSICCVQGDFYREVFDKDGNRISKETITGYTGARNHFEVSNVDKDGNRYILSNVGQLFLLSPESAATSLGYYGHILKRDNYNQLVPRGLYVEEDTLYISYHSGSSINHHYLAIFDLPSKTIFSNKISPIGYVSSGESGEIIITKDHVYTGGLAGSDKTRTSTYIVRWNKVTGVAEKVYYSPYPDREVTTPVIFKDSNNGIWYSSARYYQDNNPIQLHRINTDTMDRIETTIRFPDLMMHRASEAVLQQDGSIRIFQYSHGTQLRVIDFK